MPGTTKNLLYNVCHHIHVDGGSNLTSIIIFSSYQNTLRVLYLYSVFTTNISVLVHHNCKKPFTKLKAVTMESILGITVLPCYTLCFIL